MKNKKTFVTIIIVIIAAVLLVAVMAGRRGPKPEIVKTTEVVQGDLRSYLSTNAAVKSKNIKSYAGTPQLTVKKVNVKVGDQVKKGQVMLEYDLFDLTTSVQQAQIQYDNALLQKKDLLNQKKQINDTINKLDKQINELESSKNPADAMELQTLKQKRDSVQPLSSEKIKLAENSVSLAKLALDSATSRLDKVKTGIVADFDGVVTALNAQEGSALNPAQPAVVIQDLNSLKAMIALGKYDALKVKVGQEAVLKNGDKDYKGSVSFISPAAATSISAGGQETNLGAEIDILNPDSDLKVDFDVNVDILLGSVKDALKIPVECIKYDKDGKSSVFKLVDSKTRLVDVKLGLQSDTEAQVIEGLSKGDVIILNPGISIKDGTIVRTNVGGKQ